MTRLGNFLESANVRINFHRISNFRNSVFLENCPIESKIGTRGKSRSLITNIEYKISENLDHVLEISKNDENQKVINSDGGRAVAEK